MKSPLSLSPLPTTIPQRCRGHPYNLSGQKNSPCYYRKRLPLSQQMKREKERKKEREH
jgi:hypothetical protein